MIVNVHLADADPAGIFVREFIKNRGDHLAGSAPFRPKIHKDRRWDFKTCCWKFSLVKVRMLGDAMDKIKLSGKTVRCVGANATAI